MSEIHLANNILSAIRGEFSPAQLSARLFMDQEDIINPENYLIWFHERFHYLQTIFTPYGHLKWGAFRTITADIVEAWLQLSDIFKYKRKIPIAEYLKDDTTEGVKIAYTIWAHYTMYQIYSIVEQGAADGNCTRLFHQFDGEHTCPEISLLGQLYCLRGLDIFESYAKFEEAMLSELITGKTLGESINPDYLNTEYYSALYYFVENLGPERLTEFPVVCELALATPHIPSPTSIKEFYDNAPNWRFVKIIDVLKASHNLPRVDFNDDNSFFEYSNAVLSLCGYDTWDNIWNAAEEYAKASDLTMAQEMKAAINYKKAHPWMLSYPMCNLKSFASDDFNRFEPYFTITEDGVMYNTDNVSSSELIFENHLQALAFQICGRISKYCLDTDKLMCGYTYMGLKTCPHYIGGECDGHIDCDSVLPNVILDENKNIKSGCTFEMVLNIQEISIHNLIIGRIHPLSVNEIFEAAKKHATSDTN